MHIGLVRDSNLSIVVYKWCVSPIQGVFLLKTGPNPFNLPCNLVQAFHFTSVLCEIIFSTLANLIVIDILNLINDHFIPLAFGLTVG